MEKKEQEIKDEYKNDSDAGGDDSMAPFTSQAQMFRSMDQLAQEENKVGTTTQDEASVSKGAKKTTQNELIDLNKVTDEIVATHPWTKLIESTVGEPTDL